MHTILETETYQEVTDEDDKPLPEDSIVGVIYGRTIRANHACLFLAKDDEDSIMIRIQFHGQHTQLRSFCRRFSKAGDEMAFIGVVWSDAPIESDWTLSRLVMDVSSLEEAAKRIRVTRERHWNIQKVQEYQREYLKPEPQVQPERPLSERKANHSNGLGKRQQAEHLVNFVLQKMSKEQLTAGCGVLDVAGGSGHVSMLLGMNSIQSTVVDPREKVGLLPKRDRKVWKRAQRDLTCQPCQFNSYRAWFGAPPMVRFQDQENLPICDENDRMLEQCSAIVALHPDEATDAIVDTALKKRIPFFIVPCCVFSRLFQTRYVPGTQRTVGTYDELLEYLQAKDTKIKRAELPFGGGKCTLLWSTFTEEDE